MASSFKDKWRQIVTIQCTIVLYYVWTTFKYEIFLYIKETNLPTINMKFGDDTGKTPVNELCCQ